MKTTLATICHIWCEDRETFHDEMCIGSGAEITLSAAEPTLDSEGVEPARAAIYPFHEHGQDRPVVNLAINGDAATPLTPAEARQMAAALLEAAEAADSAGDEL